MFLTLLAQESSSGGGLVAFLPFILIAVVMYFLLIRPQRRRMQQQRELANAVDEGDEVMTTSGIYGFVTAVEGDVLWLEVAEGVDIRVARQAVSRRIPASEGAAEDGAAATEDGAATTEDGAADRSDAADQQTKGERDAPTAD
jgi:preprotein translocase subunit YajC